MNKDTKIFLSNGPLIEEEFSSGMYRAVVGGKIFCSATREGLLSALGFFFSVYTSDAPIREPETPIAIKLRNVIFGSTSLEEKQKALKTLESLVDDPVASQTVAYIKTKPTSFGASYLTRILNKQDFAYVTSVEISENVPSIIHKAELLKELGERISI